MKKIAIKRNTRSQLLHKAPLAPLQFDDASAMSSILIPQTTCEGDELLVAQTPMYIGGSCSFYSQKRTNWSLNSSLTCSNPARSDLVQSYPQLHLLSDFRINEQAETELNDGISDFEELREVSAPEHTCKDDLPVFMHIYRIFEVDRQIAELFGRVHHIELALYADERLAGQILRGSECLLKRL